MKKHIVALLTAACLLLTGCASLLDREYSIVEEHSKKYWESGAGDVLRAESYQDVVNDFLLLVDEHTETATLRLYDEEDELITAAVLERAAAEVQQETPLGAYAVEYITTESQPQRGYEEVTVRIGYRRSAEQVNAIVNATSTAALPDLLNAALEAEKPELVVRIGYWSENSFERVDTIVAEVREAWELTEETPWLVEYYPATGEVGIIEFRLNVDPSELPPAEGTPEGGEDAGDGTIGTEGESGGENAGEGTDVPTEVLPGEPAEGSAETPVEDAQNAPASESGDALPVPGNGETPAAS